MYILHQQVFRRSVICTDFPVPTWSALADDHQQPHCLLQLKTSVVSLSFSVFLFNVFIEFISQVVQEENTCGAQFCVLWRITPKWPLWWCFLRRYENHRLEMCLSITASYWSRTCSTAVHRTCDYKRHAGEPSDTSWNDPCSVHLRRQRQRKVTVSAAVSTEVGARFWKE